MDKGFPHLVADQVEGAGAVTLIVMGTKRKVEVEAAEVVEEVGEAHPHKHCGSHSRMLWQGRCGPCLAGYSQSVTVRITQISSRRRYESRMSSAASTPIGSPWMRNGLQGP